MRLIKSIFTSWVGFGYPGHSQFFNVARRKLRIHVHSPCNIRRYGMGRSGLGMRLGFGYASACNIEKWECEARFGSSLQRSK